MLIHRTHRSATGWLTNSCTGDAASSSRAAAPPPAAHLGGQVLQDGGSVHGGGGTHTTVGGGAALEQTVDTAHGELQAGTRRARDGLLLVAARALDTDGTLGTLRRREWGIWSEGWGAAPAELQLLCCWLGRPAVCCASRHVFDGPAAVGGPGNARAACPASSPLLQPPAWLLPSWRLGCGAPSQPSCCVGFEPAAAAPPTAAPPTARRTLPDRPLAPASTGEGADQGGRGAGGGSQRPVVRAGPKRPRHSPLPDMLACAGGLHAGEGRTGARRGRRRRAARSRRPGAPGAPARGCRLGARQPPGTRHAAGAPRAGAGADNRWQAFPARPGRWRAPGARVPAETGAAAHLEGVCTEWRAAKWHGGEGRGNKGVPAAARSSPWVAPGGPLGPLPKAARVVSGGRGGRQGPAPRPHPRPPSCRPASARCRPQNVPVTPIGA